MESEYRVPNLTHLIGLLHFTFALEVNVVFNSCLPEDVVTPADSFIEPELPH